MQLLAIIVFGALSHKGTCTVHIDGEKMWVSVYNDSEGPLDFAVAVGVLAFLVALGLVVTGVTQELTQRLDGRESAVQLAELGASAAFTFLWFIVFCVTASCKIGYAPAELGGVEQCSAGERSAGRSGVAFAVFSIAAWGASLWRDFVAWREGGEPEDDETSFAGAADPPDALGGSSYVEYTEAEVFQNASDFVNQQESNS